MYRNSEGNWWQRLGCMGQIGIVCTALVMCAALFACAAAASLGNGDNAQAYSNPVFVPVYYFLPDGNYGFYHNHYHAYNDSGYYRDSYGHVIRNKYYHPARSTSGSRCLINCNNHKTIVRSKRSNTRITVPKSSGTTHFRPSRRSKH